ncbi:periplasmic nitrate reductase electron transfer subunit [Psychromonas sp. psych-6C06]|uniref:nitrate reductase cytochrome c-type subunit n=1 Tax=Psychromonas sp. psych-6C06 TaxID=2058089 RepID=UPI000C34E44D|nr:nitrate reductase cytochrome c-type subunit [Psychromonas sp. psych-6C06]PKF60677.1 periplasmic nitrate reductase electron transfer subunit [Psychromonas sp. psych-6C06]
MKKLLTAIMAAGIVALTTSPAWSEDGDDIMSNNGGVSSLRGQVEISTVNKSEPLKRVPRDQNTIDRNYVQQPPMIPHTIRGYQVNLSANKCLSCHSFKNAGEMGATKISVTHFEDRDGTTLSDVSPRRYFCLQCHVTQADAKPLVENTFQPVDSLK